jgi:hypothetical protein
MNSLLAALITKLTGTELWTAVAGRVYLDRAPELAVFPYVVFSIISSVPQDTFAERIEDTLIQFDLYSTSEGATEITTLYEALKATLKNGSLAVAGSTHLWLTQENLTTTTEDLVTPAGTVGCKHWSVDYSIGVQS